MATTAMNTYSFSILVKDGFHPPVMMTENGGAAFPGFPLTTTGETYPDVSVADALGDNVVGVAGLIENADIGTVYATDTEIPVYRTGHGAQIRMYHDGDSGGEVRDGDIMCAATVTGLGHVRTLKKSLEDFIAAAAGGISVTMLGTQIQHFFSILGRSMETIASTGTSVPIIISLSI